MALSFQGSQWVQFNNSSSLNSLTTALTIGCRIFLQSNFDIWSEAIVIFEKTYSSEGDPYYQYLARYNSGNLWLQGAFGGTWGYAGFSIASYLNLNEWNTLYITWNGSTASFYVNGSLIGTGGLSGTLSAYSTYAECGHEFEGGYNSHTSNHLYQSSTKVYNVCLTAGQIPTVLDDKPSITSGLQGLWLFNDKLEGTQSPDGAGESVDKTSNNPGTPYGNPYYVLDSMYPYIIANGRNNYFNRIEGLQL